MATVDHSTPTVNNEPAHPGHGWAGSLFTVGERMTGMDIREFLAARWAEMEYSDWHHRDCQTHRTLPLPPPLGGPLSCNCGVPSYVMADVAAKRKILARHADRSHHCTEPIDRDGYTWYEAGEKRWTDIPCGDLRDLAAPFAQHPDFDPAWAVPAP